MRPYGIKPRCPYQGFSRPTSQALDVIRALIRLMELVEQAGHCFNGKLTTKNLYWLSETKTIKVWGLQIRDIVKMTESGIKADFKWIEELIRNSLFARSKVPRELKYLLGYMASDPIKYGNLIRHNICLLDDESKVGKFIILYQKLTIIGKLDQQIFQTAFSYIKCGFCGAKRDWQVDVELNDVLQKIFTYHRTGYYSQDKAGVALFGRHCSHHGTDHCVDCLLKVVEYSSADIFPMLECHVPGLFTQLQEALFEVIEISYPHKLQKLRNRCTGGG